ncbi:hypothetical protein V5R04_02905 [Jonesiaceae bacterium BS-20]|uniref:Uncharacterized protein n=1 Tax=Jonesiaceae bacterium BS-20 TaxID=3120821 RepID=A0AAU7DXW4_9MICO
MTTPGSKQSQDRQPSALDQRLQAAIVVVALGFLGWLTFRLWSHNPEGVTAVTLVAIAAGFALLRFPPRKPRINMVLTIALVAVVFYLLTPATVEKFGNLALNWIISVPVGMVLGSLAKQRKLKATAGN